MLSENTLIRQKDHLLTTVWSPKRKAAKVEAVKSVLAILEGLLPIWKEHNYAYKGVEIAAACRNVIAGIDDELTFQASDMEQRFYDAKLEKIAEHEYEAYRTPLAAC